MTMKINRRAFLGSALALGALSVVEPTKALAVTAAEKKSEVQSVAAQLNALNSDLETAIDQYNRTQDDYANATAKVEECQAKIDEQQKKIDELQTHIQTRATSMYRSGAMSYMDVLLGTGTFGDFATTWDTLNELNKDDADLVASAKVARTELENTKAELADQQQAAANAVNEAKTYKATIEAKQTEYNNLYNSLSAEYQQLLAEEQEAAAKAAEEAAKAYSPAASNDSSNASDNTSNSGSGSSSSSSSSSSNSSSSSSKSSSSSSSSKSSSSSSKSSSSSSSYSGASSIPTHGSVVDYAASRVGCPYVWGASGPSSFDCSGLVMWAYAQIGISLPHYTESLYSCAKARISVDAAQPGDVLYRSGHVGISTGGNNYIHAPHTGDVVKYASGGRWTCALRF
ncbi:MAG: NlpC/P60 family protein [Coriobacteriales bacterium]